MSGCAPQNSGALKPPTRGGDQANNETRPVVTSTPTQAAIGTDENDLDGKQIHFLHPWSGKIESELALMVDQFNQTNEWGIHVIMVSPGSAGLSAQTMWEGIEEGNPANVVAAPIDLLLAVDEKTDLVDDLDPYISSLRYGMSPAQRNDFSPIFWDEDNVGGKQYAIPAQRTATVMIYNSTWAHELGFDQAPATTEEFQQQVCAANAVQRKDTDVTNDGIGGWIINTSSPVLLNWLYAFNAGVINDQAVTFNSPEVEDAFTYLFGLSRKSCAWLGKVPQPYEYFTRRQALVYSGQMQDVQMQANNMQRLDSKDKWQVIPFPGLEKHSTVTSGFSFHQYIHNP
jgi:ABC-type glycerol-3-phosphate transport system substrate-binding protein